jgi:hypothetical protein
MTSTLRRLLAGTALATLAVFGSAALPHLGAAPAAYAQDAMAPAAGVTQADIDAVIAKLPPDVTVAYTTVITDAAMGTTTIEGLTITPKSGDQKVEIAKIVLGGFDKDALERVVDPARYTGTPEEDFRTIAASISVEGVTVTAGGQTVLTVASQTVEGWRMKQLPFNPGEVQAMMPKQVPVGVQALAGAIDSIQVDRIAATDIVIDATVPGMDGGPSQKLAYTIGEITQTALDRGNAGRGEMNRVSGTSEVEEGPVPLKINFSVATSSVDGLSLQKLIGFLAKGEMPATSERDLISIGAFAYTDYLVDIAGIGKLSFPSVTMPAIPFVWLVPQSIEFAAQGTFEPAAADAFMGGPDIRAMFLDSAPAGFKFGWKYDDAAGTGEITNYAISVGGWGEFDFGAKAGGLKLDDLPSLATRAQELLSFDGAFVKWDDDGGFDKGLDLAAKQMPAGEGAPPADAASLKSLAKMQIDMGMAMFGGDPAAAAVADAVKAFIDTPGTLTITSAPPSPLKMDALGTIAGLPPAEQLKTLGISATYTP